MAGWTVLILCFKWEKSLNPLSSALSLKTNKKLTAIDYLTNNKKKSKKIVRNDLPS